LSSSDEEVVVVPPRKDKGKGKMVQAPESARLASDASVEDFVEASLAGEARPKTTAQLEAEELAKHASRRKGAAALKAAKEAKAVKKSETTNTKPSQPFKPPKPAQAPSLPVR